MLTYTDTLHLFKSIQYHQKNTVEFLLNRPDINIFLRTDKGLNVLHAAAQMGDPAILHELLQKEGAYKLLGRTDPGFSPLHLAIEKKSMDMVEIILSQKNSKHIVNIQTKDGKTPVYIAAENGLIHILKKLIRAKANYSQCDQYHRTPLWIAAKKGYVKTCDLILSQKDGLSLINEENNMGFTPLLAATVEKRSSIVKLLLNKGADPNKATPFGITPLYMAVGNSDHSIVEQLLKHPNIGASLNKFDINDQYTPLILAVNNNDSKTVNLLLQCDHIAESFSIPTKEHGYLPLHLAIMENFTDIAMLLLNQHGI